MKSALPFGSILRKSHVSYILAPTVLLQSQIPTLSTRHLPNAMARKVLTPGDKEG